MRIAHGYYCEYTNIVLLVGRVQSGDMQLVFAEANTTYHFTEPNDGGARVAWCWFRRKRHAGNANACLFYDCFPL